MSHSVYPDVARSSMQNFVLGLSLVVIAGNLRPVFTSLSVLLNDISQTFHMSGFETGLLTTLPVLCLGIFAPLAPFLTQRIGLNQTLFVALILLFLGILMRGIGQFHLLYVGAIFAGSAIAIGNVLLPTIVKRDFPKHMSIMTALYTMSLCGGAAVAVGLTVPLKYLLGGSWPLALGVWAVPVCLAIFLWLPQAFEKKKIKINERYKVKGLLHDPLAWQITFFMGMQSSLGYIVFGWLAPILHERGISLVDSGSLVSVSIMVQAASCMVIPLIAGHRASQSMLNLTLCFLAIMGMLGFIFAPLSTVWLWVFVQGVGQGGLIAAAMMVIVLRSRDAYVASNLSGMAQCIGYILAAGGPLLVGVVHDWSGSFKAASFIFVFYGVIAGVMGYLAGRPLYCNVSVEYLPNKKTKVLAD